MTQKKVKAYGKNIYEARYLIHIFYNIITYIGINFPSYLREHDTKISEANV